MTRAKNPVQDTPDRQALAWFVRNQQQDAPGADFAAWRAADPVHERAYARVEGLWNSDAFGAAAGRLPRRQPRRAAMSAALAAVLVLGGGVAGLRLTGIALAWPSDHSTRIGAIAETALEDGTRLTLDTASAVDVDYAKDARHIRLRGGRIFVAVAPDRRPLSISAGDTVIRDIGTSFSVEQRGGAILVAVRDGAVEMAAPGGARQTLHGGQRSAYAASRFDAVSTANLTTDFGWTRHRLYFSDRPLGEVADELRRYHRGWIFIASDRIARIRISGGLSLNDPAAAMEELARLSGANLSRVSDHLLILR